MFLRYIEIHGFKSFPDKTRIEFDKGFTAVVGPNGSGKSNISDAVRWVLGEQSTKALRGGKMEDVIFSGTQLRGAMGYAAVTICLDNSDGRIKDAGAELQVTRRYYRSGDSEYLINGAVVRLRDVRELFLDTGLGRDGYSMIEQGKIAEVVSAKGTDRREIFEEAAGIAKYRFRKNEADRKLLSAEENLALVRVQLDELEQRVGPLKKQMEKAKEFLALSEQRKGYEITLYCDTLRRAQEQLREQDDKLLIASQDYKTLDERLTEIAASIEHNSELSRGYAVKIEQCNERIRQLTESMGGFAAQIAVINNEIARNDAEMERLDADKTAFGDTQTALEARIAEINASVEQKRQQLEQRARDIAEAERALQELVLGNEQRDRERLETARRIAELAGATTDCKVAAVADRSAVESGEKRIEELETQLAAQQELCAAAKKELDGYLSEQQRIAGELDSLSNRKKGYEQLLASRSDAFKADQARLNSLSFAADEADHRIKVLRDLDKSMDGFAPSVKRVIEAKNRRELAGIVGPVSELISIRSGCELALETALGAALQNIVVESESSAKAAIAFLKQSKAGRATFLPLDTVKARGFDGNVTPGRDGVVGAASELVECDAKYRPAVDFLLGNIVVVEDIDSASATARRLRYRCRIATLDGQIINAGGSYTGGFVSRSSGVFSRRLEIEAQQQKLLEIEKQRAQLVEKQRAQQAEIQKLQAEVTALESDGVNLGGEKIRIDTTVEQKRGEKETLAARLDELSAQKERIISENAARRAHIDELAATLAQQEKESAELDARSKDEARSGEDYLAGRSRLQDTLSQLKLERLELEKDVESALAGAQELKKQGEDAQKGAEGLEARKSELRAASERQRAEAAQQEASRKAAEEEITLCRAEIEDCVNKRMLKESESTSLRAEERDNETKREKAAGEKARLEERRSSCDADYERCVRQLWEDYELTPPEAEKLCVQYENITWLRARVTELRGKIKALGSVNVAAIEEYAEVSDRYEFLKAQYDDVDGSRKELQKLIHSLTDEMRTLFSKSFEEINRNFGRVFYELFGGGAARLYLTDESDVLESGIEMDVQPPGKVIKNLSSLSGGEQALVAIALYFAILAVNPSPFCILDEIDSALDDGNVSRYADYIKRIMDRTQFIAITHRRGTMEAADIIYGVTMQEEGVSKLLKLDIEHVDASAIS